MTDIYNKVYGLFWFKEAGEPPLKINEFRSLKEALIHKMEIMEKCQDYNLRILVRDCNPWKYLDGSDVSELYFLEDEEL